MARKNNTFYVLGYCALFLAAIFVGLMIGTIIGLNTRDSLDQQLICSNAHLSQGTHKVVITEQFTEALNESVYTDKDRALGNLNKACERLSSVCKHLDFEFSYDSEYTENDIPIYLSIDYLKNENDNANYIGFAYHNVKEDGTLYNQKVVFHTWSLIQSYGYSLALHELMHEIGFKHQTENSVLEVGKSNKHDDLTDYDISLLEKYEKRFYRG